MEHKFKIGQIVTIKGVEQRFLIQEISTITCSAGTQTLYHGVVIVKRYYGYNMTEERAKWYLDRETKFNELLLEEVK